MANVHWFPGHMAKALREIEQKLKLVDLVIEIVDSRIPYSSKNPVIHNIIKNKPKLMVLTKKDLADSNVTNEWISYYEKEGYTTINVNLNQNNSISQIVAKISDVMEEKKQRQIAKGMKPQATRMLVVGVPNVGKSTFINRMAKRKATVVGNRPGVTKMQQVIRVGSEFELFDTPGVLWHRFTDEKQGINLAITDAIKDTIIPSDDICLYALKYLFRYYKQNLKDRYEIELDDLNVEDDSFFVTFLDRVAIKRKMLMSGNAPDYDRAIFSILKDIKEGYLGKISWERVGDVK